MSIFTLSGFFRFIEELSVKRLIIYYLFIPVLFLICSINREYYYLYFQPGNEMTPDWLLAGKSPDERLDDLMYKLTQE